MKELYKYFTAKQEYLKNLWNDLSLQWKIGIIFIIGLSIFIKAFYFIYNQAIIGPDSYEYIETAEIFRKNGIKYIFSSDYYTFWRLPLLPLLIAICGTLPVLYILQLFSSYYLAYLLYKIFLFCTGNKKISLVIGFCSLFLPFINIAACSALSEYIQVFLIVFIFKNLLYRNYSLLFILSITFLCFLRAEGFTFLIFLIIRELFYKNYRNILKMLIPFVFIFLWMLRNLLIFDSFSMINPIMSSRAMIGSIYGAIYVPQPHSFHKQYNYYEGMDFVKNRKFVEQYKSTVKKELFKNIINDPTGYLIHRGFWITKTLSYISFNGEMLPDQEWNLVITEDWNQRSKINEIWAYNHLVQKKDFLRLALRLLYNGLLTILIFTGLFFLLFNYKKYIEILFLFTTFSYILIVEADMRYFITIQLFCVSSCLLFIYEIYSIIKHKYYTSKIPDYN